MLDKCRSMYRHTYIRISFKWFWSNSVVILSLTLFSKTILTYKYLLRLILWKTVPAPWPHAIFICCLNKHYSWIVNNFSLIFWMQKSMTLLSICWHWLVKNYWFSYQFEWNHATSDTTNFRFTGQCWKSQLSMNRHEFNAHYLCEWHKKWLKIVSK